MKFLPYMIVMAGLFAAMDYYFIRSWKKFVISRDYNHWLYKSVYIIAALCFMMLSYNLIYRTVFGIFNTFQWVTFLIVTLWYLPKLAIVPIMLLKDFALSMQKQFKRKEIINHKEPNLSRRRMLQTGGWLLAGAPYVIVAKNAFHNTYALVTKKVQLTINKIIPNSVSFKICQLSDIHGGSLLNGAMAKEAVELIHNMKPDAVVVTGDFVNFNPKELDIVFNELKSISAPFGKYACLGNHDHYMSDEEHESLKAKIKGMGFDLLINEHRIIEKNGAKLQIAGIDDLSFHNKFGDVEAALAGTDETLPTILLAHDPSIWDKEILDTDRKVDIMLSGHTHGGQINLALGFGSIAPARFVYKYFIGLYKKADRYLYVNSGFGTTGPPLRIGVPPEITEINIKSQNTA